MPRNSIPILLHCLRVVISLQCFGIAGKFLLSSYETESAVFEWLLFDLGWPEPLVQMIDNAAALGCSVTGIWLLLTVVFALCSNAKGEFTPNSGEARVSNSDTGFVRTTRIIEICLLMAVTIWLCLIAMATSIRGGIYSELMFGEVAVRIMAPFVLILLLNWKLEPTKAIWLLRVAVTATFAVHGYKAVMHYGPFVDLILLTDLRLTGFEPSQAAIEISLSIIGWVDVALAFLVVSTRWRWVAGYMFFWGVITAISRMTAFGSAAWPETLIRSANWGVPFVVLVGFMICENQLSRSK